MSAGTRLPWAEAASLAREVVSLLNPSCERLVVAGSLRRHTPDCGDVEIVCTPAFGHVRTEQVDLFGTFAPLPRPNMLEETCSRLLSDGTFRPRLNKLGRQSVGPKLKWVTYRHFALDIYVAEPDNFGLVLAIRTGPAEFSKALVTPRRQGGLLPDYLQVRDNFHLVHRRDGGVIPTPEEQDVFNALGLGCLEPRERSWPLPRTLKEVG